MAKEIEGYPISFGGLIGIAKSEYDWGVLYDNWSYTYFVLGARAAYHLKLDSPKIDPYAELGYGFGYLNLGISYKL